MASYLKNYTKAEGTRPIVVKQSGFISGMNLDSPSRDLEATSLAYCENMIPKRSRLDPRAGSELVGSLPTPYTDGLRVLIKDGVNIAPDPATWTSYATTFGSGYEATFANTSGEVFNSEDKYVTTQQFTIAIFYPFVSGVPSLNLEALLGVQKYWLLNGGITDRNIYTRNPTTYVNTNYDLSPTGYTFLALTINNGTVKSYSNTNASGVIQPTLTEMKSETLANQTDINTLFQKVRCAQGSNVTVEKIAMWNTALSLETLQSWYDLGPTADPDLTGSSTFHGWINHPSGKVVAHIGNKIYVSTDLNTWTEATGTWSVADAPSTMQVYRDDLLIFQGDRIIYCELSNSNYMRLFNAPNPKYALSLSTGGDSGDFIYRYTYTYARYVNDVLVAESGSYGDRDYKSYFTEVSLSEPLDGSIKVQLNEVPAPLDSEDGTTTQWTHIHIYRTRDIGINNESQKNQYYLCESRSIVDGGLAGIGDMVIEGVPVFKVASDNGGLNLNDDDLLAETFLNKLFYIPIPNGLIGSVSNGVVTIQDGENSKVNYTFTGVSERVGYYFEGTQFNDVDGKIKAIKSLDGYSAIICEDRTYLQIDQAYQTQSDSLGADIGMVIDALDKLQLVDANIGVNDPNTIAYDNPSQFVAVCSDGSLRAFTRSGWSSTDYGRDRVSKELKKIASGSSSFFHPEGFYLLSYSTDTSSDVSDKTLRLGFTEDQGSGWSYYGGDGWVTPQKAQSYLKMNFGGYLRVFCVNNDGKIFWVESYDGPIGSGLTRKTKDRVGDTTEYEIPSIIEFPEASGSSIGYYVRHLQSTFNLVPYERDETISADNRVTAVIYKNDQSQELGRISKVSSLKNMIFAKDVMADYLRLRLEIEKSEISVLDYEMILEVLDMPKTNLDEDEVFNFQLLFNTNVAFDMSRIDNNANNVKSLKSGDKYGTDTGTVTTVVGMDGKSTSGVSF